MCDLSSHFKIQRILWYILQSGTSVTVLRYVSDVTFNFYVKISFNKLNSFHIILQLTTQTIYAILTDTYVLL